MATKAFSGVTTESHPYRVAVYAVKGAAPVRTFPGYKTARDAETFAESLRGQARRNGWTHTIQVEKD